MLEASLTASPYSVLKILCLVNMDIFFICNTKCYKLLVLFLSNLPCYLDCKHRFFFFTVFLQMVFTNAFLSIEYSYSGFIALTLPGSSLLIFITSAETGYPFRGILWFPDLLQPDPYYILPVSVGVLGIFNFFVSNHLKISIFLQI